mgnify:CR=1 FL=1
MLATELLLQHRRYGWWMPSGWTLYGYLLSRAHYQSSALRTYRRAYRVVLVPRWAQ